MNTNPMSQPYDGDFAADLAAQLPDGHILRELWAASCGADPTDDEAWREYLRRRAAVENKRHAEMVREMP